MSEIMERIVMYLIAIMKISQEIFKILFIDIDICEKL